MNLLLRFVPLPFSEFWSFQLFTVSVVVVLGLCDVLVTVVYNACVINFTSLDKSSISHWIRSQSWSTRFCVSLLKFHRRGRLFIGRNEWRDWTFWRPAVGHFCYYFEGELTRWDFFSGIRRVWTLWPLVQRLLRMITSDFVLSYCLLMFFMGF